MVSKFGKYILRRVLEMIPTMIAVISINFVLIHLAPGDPTTILVARQASPEYVASVRESWGLNKPLYEQYLIYLGNVLSGNLGDSFTYKRPVLDVVMERVPYTIWLVLPVELAGFAFGTLLGAYSAKKYPSKVEWLVSGASLVALSVPVFWLGLLLILCFSVNLALFPSGGIIDPRTPSSGAGYVFDVLRHSILPWATLMIWNFPGYQRVTKASILEVMREDYITTARCKGLDKNAIFYKHALRNAILPGVSLLGLWIGYVLTGVLLVEIVFGWPGMGRLIYQAVTWRDYNLVMGTFIISSILVLVASLLTDITYSRLDPRVVYD